MPSPAMTACLIVSLLPMFGEREVDKIMDELTACRNANPGDHIRIIGYDGKRQTQGLSMVVHRAGE